MSGELGNHPLPTYFAPAGVLGIKREKKQSEPTLVPPIAWHRKWKVRVTYGRLKSIRLQVFERDGFKCVKCGSEIELTYDHIIPKSKGGKYSFENGQTLCRSCNNKKGDAIEDRALGSASLARGTSDLPGCQPPGV